MPKEYFTIKTNFRFRQWRFSLVKVAGTLFGWDVAGIVWDLVRPASVKVLDYPWVHLMWADLFNRFGGAE